MPIRRWQVWSLDPQSGRWVVVDEGSPPVAKASARSHQETADRLGIEGAEYRALPPGREPDDEQDGPSQAELRAADERFRRDFLGEGATDG